MDITHHVYLLTYALKCFAKSHFDPSLLTALKIVAKPQHLQPSLFTVLNIAVKPQRFKLSLVTVLKY